MSIFISMYKEKNMALPLVPPNEGGTYIITGANTGLDFECPQNLVRLSAGRVKLAVRSIDKVAEVEPLDLTSYDSVKGFAKKNASIAVDSYTISEGFETSIAVNVREKHGLTPHLVVTGSGAALSAKGQLEKVEGNILKGLTYNTMGERTQRYFVTKLLQLYAVQELAALKPCSETGVVISCVNPGFCNTGLSRHARFTKRIEMNLMQFLVATTADQGRRTILHAATAGKQSHGKYLSNCEAAEEDPLLSFVTNEAGMVMQKRVCDSISRKLNEIQPRCFQEDR
ncbi:hypothetical protein P152DRAFT_464624 [Eremomyces bilateralis CBS 781.70]|uniref:NAD(P)-binding protein n=1 Tax=Eremomyces bilateralis CBS 781.70 TaxID=1392243 RepID=A0A6G1GD54_9PEZI|nr:uncharacterized protein P152DRAFT_464624 [Eremomyces bilateralis CBS 781.70]KAF1815942.1 hypothetical protein P152DRAFT_464624 [Eremomyces bilateralis CBS 781.70]